MGHLLTEFPQRVAIGATRKLDWNTEVVTLDSGGEVRNNRWSSPLLVFEMDFVPTVRDDADYIALIALYQEAQGMLHSFNFTDWTDETGNTQVPVRFDAPLELTGMAVHLDQVVSIALREVRL